MSTHPLTTRLDGPVSTITLNAPETRNALSMAMLEGLLEVLADAAASDARVIVLAAEGSVFCPGHDLKEITAARQSADRGRTFYEQVMARCAEVMLAIVRHPLPVIADVRGMATAAGCQLVASCDLALATEHARFATPGVNIGLFCSTPMVALARNVSRKHAMEMLLTGDPISAEEAARIGLINAVVPEAELDTRLAELTAKIASKSAPVLKIGKRAFTDQLEMPLEAAYAHCAQVMVENMLMQDAEEGIGAFLDKRDPVWPEPQ